MPSVSFVFLSIILFLYSPLSPITAQSSAVICPEGSYYSLLSNQCLLCPVGHYQDYPGRTECIKCPRDMYSDREGATECTRCSSGYYAPATGSLSCMACRAGYYIDPAMAFQRLSLCLPCNPGQWSAPASSSCTNCAAGSYNNKEGSTDCSPCPSNTYSAVEGSNECTPCPAGLYSAQGSASCSANISPNSNNNGQEASVNGGGVSSSSLSRNTIIAIAAGSSGGLLLLGLIVYMIHRYHQKKDMEKNRLMIEQTKRSSLNRSSFSQSINTAEREDSLTVGV